MVRTGRRTSWFCLFDQSPSPQQGHVFSLGSTLSAALDFVIEPELQQAELGEEALRMLELMQAELPDDRPRPQVRSF